MAGELKLSSNDMRDDISNMFPCLYSQKTMGTPPLFENSFSSGFFSRSPLQFVSFFTLALDFQFRRCEIKGFHFPVAVEPFFYMGRRPM
jgi:hypothetical protein